MSNLGKILAAALVVGTVAAVASTYRGGPKPGDRVVVPVAKILGADGMALPAGVIPAGVGSFIVQIAGVTGDVGNGVATHYVDPTTGKAQALVTPDGVPVSFKIVDIAGHVDAAGNVKK